MGPRIVKNQLRMSKQSYQMGAKIEKTELGYSQRGTKHEHLKKGGPFNSGVALAPIFDEKWVPKWIQQSIKS